MKKYRIKESISQAYYYNFETSAYTLEEFVGKRCVQMKIWYGWKTIKEFGTGDFEGKRAQELLDLLNEDL